MRRDVDESLGEVGGYFLNQGLERDVVLDKVDVLRGLNEAPNR